MASFKIQNVATLEEYEIKVGSCILYGLVKETPSGDVNSVPWYVRDGSYMHVISNGDILTDVIPYDTWLQNQFSFVNNPQYTIKARYAYNDIIGKRYVYGGANPIQVTMRLRYARLSIYKNNVFVQDFAYISDHVTNDYDNTVEYCPVTVPYADAIYRQCLMMDTLNQAFYQYNPHLITITNMVQNPAFLNGARLNEMMGVLHKITPPIDYNIFIDFKTKYIQMGVPRIGLEDSNTKYQVETVQGTDIIQTVDTGRSPNVATGSTFNWDINDIPQWDFLYSLLFDKIPDDDGTGGDDPYPNPNPPTPNQPDPKPPPYEGGGGDHDDGSDPIDFPDLPDINPVSTGAVTLYQMGYDTFRSFLEYIWDDPKFLTIAKILTDPMDAVLSAHMVTVNVPTSGTNDIIVGNINTDIKANIIPNNFISVDFGTINISEYYGDGDDYNTVVQIYLPYYGYVTLNTYEVMGSTIHLMYYIDVLTGSFAALLNVSKTTKGTTLNSVLYQFNGTLEYSIPLSSQNMTGIINGIINLAQLRPNISDFHIGYERASNLSSNTGIIAIRKAYIAILRQIHTYTNGRSHYVGYPYQQIVMLGNLKGYTQCIAVFINTVIGTPEETEMIRQLLLGGVLL